MSWTVTWVVCGLIHCCQLDLLMTRVQIETTFNLGSVPPETFLRWNLSNWCKHKCVATAFLSVHGLTPGQKEACVRLWRHTWLTDASAGLKNYFLFIECQRFHSNTLLILLRFAFSVYTPETGRMKQWKESSTAFCPEKWFQLTAVESDVWTEAQTKNPLPRGQSD